MPKHTTHDPAKRALHIAEREANERWAQGDLAFCDNVLTSYDTTLSMGLPPRAKTGKPLRCKGFPVRR